MSIISTGWYLITVIIISNFMRKIFQVYTLEIALYFNVITI